MANVDISMRDGSAVVVPPKVKIGGICLPIKQLRT